MPSPLPARANLDWLKQRAKRTLITLRKTRPSARLADAQLAVARDHGFQSWRAMKAEVEARRVPPPAPVAPAPIDDAIVGPFLQLVGAGRVADVRRVLAAIPSIVNAVGPHPFWGGRPQPLHVAIETGRRPMIDLLLASGADVNGSNEGYDRWSPLLIAIDRKRRALIRLLRSRGARVDLAEALALGDDRAVGRLLASGRTLPAAPNAGSWLNLARTPAAIDRLLEAGARTDLADRWGATPIEAMSRLGRAGRPLVRHLVDRGFKATPADFARMGDRRMVSTMLRADAAVIRDPAVLMAAVDFGHHGLAAWLLDQGADPNGRSGSRDRTPLHSAAWNGDLRMVELLIGAGADRTLRDRQYDGIPRDWAETSIEVTANQRCRKVVDYLTE